ncbi:hypothetical protein [Paraclostridium bifermentans]|uniref:hypothetical protein n=1 Tax=Paraclostridium bifermentans TaxID=1490 RepID=UPI00359C1BF9
MKTKELKIIAKGLNDLNCKWGVGGSVMLNHYDLVDKPNDIDILADPDYVDKIKAFMDTVGEYVELPSKEPFETDEFFGYIVEDTMVEFLCGFKINLGNENMYEFLLDEDSIVDNMILDGVKINLTTPEDWFVAYSVMKDPKNRIPLLKEFFKKYGLNHRNLLQRNLNQDLPKIIKDEINELLLLSK